MYEDKTLNCKDCNEEFIFTAGEQEFYAEKGFVNEPQRCKTCRDARKNGARGEREMFEATCANCGPESPKFRSDRVKTALYIAARALQSRDRTHNPS
jgi:hypothetical protein